MKDFYDIWLLSRQFDFDGSTLASAIEKIFANRNTTVIEQPMALLPAFTSNPTKVIQWEAFIRKSRLTDTPNDLAAVIDTLFTFLVPPAAAIIEGHSFGSTWNAPGPWIQN